MAIRYVLLLFCALLPLTSAKAEYRAFRLAIKNATTGTGRTVVSTLDNEQYRQYHPLPKDDVVTIESTWMCWRRSEGEHPICPDPRPAEPVPASVP